MFFFFNQQNRQLTGFCVLASKSWFIGVIYSREIYIEKHTRARCFLPHYHPEINIFWLMLFGCTIISSWFSADFRVRFLNLFRTSRHLFWSVTFFTVTVYRFLKTGFMKLLLFLSLLTVLIFVDCFLLFLTGSPKIESFVQHSMPAF